MKRIRTKEYLEWQRNHKKEIHDNRRMFALNYLGNICKNCGSFENLEIDHIDKNSKSFAISRPSNDKVFLEELKKCQLLCNDCHKEKTKTEMNGEKHPNAKLTQSQVDEIRERLNNGEIGRHLAKEFGVGPMQISRIKNFKRWSN